MTVEDRMEALLNAEMDARERQAPVRRRRDPNQPWTVDEVLRRLQRSDIFVERALMVLYARQTTDEQNSQSTRETNGVGFNQADAYWCTKLARQVIANRDDPNSRYHTEGTRLSERQRAIARDRLKKYAGQLADHANRNRHAS